MPHYFLKILARIIITITTITTTMIIPVHIPALKTASTAEQLIKKESRNNALKKVNR